MLMEVIGISHWGKWPPIILNANCHNYAKVQERLMGMSFFLVGI